MRSRFIVNIIRKKMENFVKKCLTKGDADAIISERFRQGAQKYARGPQKKLRKMKKVLDKFDKMC